MLNIIFIELSGARKRFIWYCIWGNAWIVDMENMSIFDLNPMIRNLWTLWYIGNLKVLIYLVLYYLESIDTKHFWQEILLRILWIFDCCNTLWNYLEVNYVFWIHWTCELLMWLCPCAMMLVIIPSWWQQAKLETHTLHDTGKSLSVWVRLLPIGPKDLMQKGYCATRHSLLPMGGRGKLLSVWVRLGKAKRSHAKEVLHDMLSPAAYEGDK